MATDKKSFILYCDQRGTWERLSNEQAGKLIKHVLAYVNDENPEADFITELAFEGIKRALKADLIKYEQIKTKRIESGRKGGKQTQANQASATSAKANQAVNGNGNVIVNGILLEKETKGLFNEWLDFRKKMRKPIIVESTLISLAKKIKAEGYLRSREVIQHSMDNQYQGLFWKKQKEKDSTMELPTEYPKNSWE
tara:strand:- start:728 stop:1315 length:588 start_codon:yes stop_codon:yes gene_type:complete